MNERPSTSSGNRSFQPSAPPLRPNTSSGGHPAMSAAHQPGTQTPPNEHRRGAGAASSPRPKVKDNSGTYCRNITIYGYCRYEKSGCTYGHDMNAQRQPPNGGNSLSRGKFNVDSPSFTPSTPPKTSITAKVVDAPPFTPKGLAGAASPPAQPQFTTEAMNNMNLADSLDSVHDVYSNYAHSYGNAGFGESASAQAINPYSAYSNVTASGQINPYVSGQADFFQSQTAHPLPYHLYTSTAPYREKLQPFQRNAHDFFISDNRREELTRKMEAVVTTLNGVSHLPQTIDAYYSLLPLDTLDQNYQKPSRVFEYPSKNYKAFSNKDGKTYLLRRIEGFRLAKDSDIRIVQRWAKILNANIVNLHDAWTTTKFGDSSIVFVYDYHPLAKTLKEHHFGQNSVFPNQRVPENVLWSYIVQICSALKTIHNSGLAARVIDLSKIIMTSKMSEGVRLRLNCCGILDVIRPEENRPVTAIQQEDFLGLGRVILSVATNSVNLPSLTSAQPHPNTAPMYQRCLELLAKQYSQSLKEAVSFLVSGQVSNIDEFLKSIASYVVQNFNSALHDNDALEQDLMQELENGRLVRLMCKFNFVNDRPEHDGDPRWKETGDRYLLILFRDYVFHPVDEHGQPFVDLAHVITCLNKLDAGIEEKIMLVSRTSEHCFVLSYKDIKLKLEAAFKELTQPSRR